MTNKTEYIKLYWEHEPDNEPVVILYEINVENDRLARRSIDIFADGTCKNINDLYKDVIEIVPIPTVEEFNSHIWGEEFHACLIRAEEFEKYWENGLGEIKCRNIVNGTDYGLK